MDPKRRRPHFGPLLYGTLGLALSILAGLGLWSRAYAPEFSGIWANTLNK